MGTSSLSTRICSNGSQSTRTLCFASNIDPGHSFFRGPGCSKCGPRNRAPEEVGEELRGGFRARPSEFCLPGEIDESVGQLVEIAVRALSPGINNPSTAIACVDQLARAPGRMAGVGARVVAERSALASRHFAAGRPRSVAAGARARARSRAMAFDQVRRHARGTPSVSLRLIQAGGSSGCWRRTPCRGQVGSDRGRDARSAPAQRPSARPRAGQEQEIAALRDPSGPDGDRSIAPRNARKRPVGSTSMSGDSSMGIYARPSYSAVR